MKMEKKHGLIHQIYSVPALIRQQYEDLEPKIRTALSTIEIFSFTKVIITGCGDSYASALAVKDAFRDLTGLDVEALAAVDLSRTLTNEVFGKMPNNPLVIAVSNSGKVVRTNEAVIRATTHGAFSLVVTGNPESSLAKSASRVLDLEVPPFEAAPGTRSYVVSLIALILLAIRIGEVRCRYTMDCAMAMRYDILKQADELEKLLPGIDGKMKNLADKWQNMDAYDFVGTGMEFGTAWYMHAKILEQLGKYSFYSDNEDWLHTNLFLRKNESTATIVLADDRNPAFGRTQELVSYAKSLKRPLLVLGSIDGELCSIGVPRTDFYMNSCLTQFVPVSILANYIADLIDEEDGRGCKDVWSIAEDAKCIVQSEVVIL
jgi:glucosamine--fructose-6-phosphate aminotransferase (isomerizing)